MGVIIKIEEGEYRLWSISHNPVILTPYTNPTVQDFSYSIPGGYMLDLCGLEVDKEYEHLDHKDFEECIRYEKSVNPPIFVA